TLNHDIYEIPSEWRPFLIQYKHLKKIIHKIEHDLSEIGMPQEIEKTKFKAVYGFKLEYSFKDDNNHVRICINVDFEGGERDHKWTPPKVQLSTFIHPTESSLSKCENDPISLCSYISDDSQCYDAKVVDFDDFMEHLPSHNDESVIRIEEVLENLKKTLCVEREFFDNLLKEISQLNHLQQINQEQFSNEFKKLRTLLIDTTSPYKKDLYVWREIFKKYILAEIFIGNIEIDRKERGWELAQKKLNKFNEELNILKLSNKLKEPSSKTILEEFLKWKPIRLCCGHVFCIQCLISAGRKGIKNCPICRAENAIFNADSSNLDVSLMNFLKLYFPSETKQKQNENDRERAIQDIQILTGRIYH
ncbi:2194_t:CDS:2, partial [Diversispora eburnea]